MRKREFAFLLAVGFCCVACGGGGGSAPQVPNPNAGTYFGAYIDDSGQIGQFQLTVNPTGIVSGQYVAANGTVNSVKGSVGQTGDGRLTYESSPATITMSGVDPTQSNVLSIFTNQTGNPTVDATLTLLPPKVLASDNPFTGSYGGYILDTTTNTKSALSIAVAPWGAFTGRQITIGSRGNFQSADIVGTISSSGALSYTNYYGQAVTAIGNLSKFTNVHGTVQLSNGDSANIVLYWVGSTFGPPPPSK